MRPGRSAYYPPRANALSRLRAPVRRYRLFRAAQDALAQRFRKYTYLPSIPLSQLALAILLPGLGFWLRGQKGMGRVAMFSALGLIIACFAFLGSPVSTIVFALLLCLHATGLCYFLEPALCFARLGYRIAFSLAVTIGLALLLYMPIRSFIENHALCPVRSGEKVLVVRQLVDVRNLRRGDIIAFRVNERSVPGLRIREGIGLGPILAKPGDTVEFFDAHYLVNGMQYPRLPFMPRNGSLRVEPDWFFVWPNLKRNGIELPAGHESVLMEIGTVTEEDILGKAMKRWFWREQSL